MAFSGYIFCICLFTIKTGHVVLHGAHIDHTDTKAPSLHAVYNRVRAIILPTLSAGGESSYSFGIRAKSLASSCSFMFDIISMTYSCGNIPFLGARMSNTHRPLLQLLEFQTFVLMKEPEPCNGC